MESDDPLQLDGGTPVADVSRVARVEKEHDYAHYVGVYGKQVRTIKWWVQQGRAAEGGPDLPPLDRPVDMPTWWARRMKQRCPAAVMLAARAAAGEVETPPKAPAPSLVPNTFRVENAAITTQEEDLRHLREQLARARHEMLQEQERAEVDPRAVEVKEKKWREIREEVDKAEEAVFKMKSKQGRLVDLDQVGLHLLPMLVTTANSFRSLMTRLKPRLAQTTSDEERDMIWQKGVDECFAGLVEAGFAPREMLSLAA